MKRRLSFALIIVMMLAILPGCGKENKYVNVGVNMSTAGMSLYLTNVANGLKKISTYVLFAKSSEEAVDRVRTDNHAIDITYLPVKDLGMIGKDDALTVVFPDCFSEGGELKGVWVARNGWLTDAPNYSYKFILGLALSTDYRAEHFSMSYGDALASMKGVRDVDWAKYTETMQYCAVYALSNKEELADEPFKVFSAKEMLEMFEGFERGEGRGYELCREAYSKYCTGNNKSFEELFDFTLALKAYSEAINGE